MVVNLIHLTHEDHATVATFTISVACVAYLGADDPDEDDYPLGLTGRKTGRLSSHCGCCRTICKARVLPDW